MKKRIIASMILILIAAGTLGVFLSDRNLSRSIDTTHIKTYIPGGFANSYRDVMFFGFDDYRIWSYDLNQSEEEAILAETKNKIWKSASKKDYEEIINLFFEPGDENYPDRKPSKNIYYCIFDRKRNRYVDLYSEEFGYWVIFVYDEAQKTFWCVSKSI